MFRDHRRALGWALVLLAICLTGLFAVGRHPSQAAPTTTIAFIGHLDADVHAWMDEIQNGAVTGISKALDRIGGGVVTIPVRIIAVLLLLFRRRWRSFVVFSLTWVVSEVALTSLKVWFHRGRPPGGLVAVSGFSFPSGHAVAASATAVALVLAFLPSGERRRVWEWIAATFAFVMALSRVYLSAHWFSDVVVGTLLGAGIAVLIAAAVTEVQDGWFQREHAPIPPDEDLVVR